CEPCRQGCSPAAGPPAAKKTKSLKKESLFGFLLLLLTDADLEVQHFSVLERFVIVPRHGVGEVLVDVRFLRQHGHQGEIIVAGRAEGPEAPYIRNCHNSI